MAEPETTDPVDPDEREYNPGQPYPDEPVYAKSVLDVPDKWSRLRAMLVTFVAIAALCAAHKWAGGVNWPLSVGVMVVTLAYTARGTLDKALTEGFLSKMKQAVVNRLPK